MQISKVLTRNLVTIPSEVAKALDIHPGDYLKVEQEGNAIRMAPVMIEEKWLQEELEGLRAIHQAEKHKSQRIRSKSAIRALLES